MDARLIVGYETDFVAVIMCELHKRAFGDLTIMPFPFLIQQLCNEVGVLEISHVNRRLEATSMA